MPKPIGLQLCSLRGDVYPGGDDLPGVLKTVAEIGFKGVEFAGLHGMDPKEIARILDGLGLVVSSSHVPVPDAGTVSKIADEQSSLGNKRLIGMYGPDEFKSLDAVRHVAQRVQTAAELLMPYGMTFGYHNHWWEFQAFDGIYAFDILMAEAPDVFSELDTYWCAYAKSSPVMAAKAYGARMPFLHIKDGMLEEEKHSHTAVGSGKMNIPAIISACDPKILEWLVVELDTCESDMLQAVKESYSYLTSTGLASGTK